MTIVLNGTLGDIRRALVGDLDSLPDETPFVLAVAGDVAYASARAVSLVVACPGDGAKIWYGKDDDRSNGITAQQAVLLT